MFIDQCSMVFYLDSVLCTPIANGLNLHHVDYGGFIQGSWRLWGSDSLPIPTHPLVDERTLFHVINSSSKVTNFIPCPATPDTANTFQEV